MLSEITRSDGGAIQKHVSATYHTLRLGVVLLAVAFPVVLWLGGSLLGGLGLQDSMSHYYHAGPPDSSTGTMRDFFVGFLFALGAVMYLYKGFTKLENGLLNVASALAVCVALFPMAWPSGGGGGMFSLHGVSAIGAFVCLALVAWLSPGRSLTLMQDDRRRAWYTRAYRLAAGFMLVFPVVAWVLTAFFGQPSATVFVTEALGLYGFAGFWALKSGEMKHTQAEVRALRGELAIDAG